MRNFLIILISIFIMSCAGYKPLYSPDSINYFISEVNFDRKDKISQALSKKLLYSGNQENLRKLVLNLESSLQERVLSNNSKGNPENFELKIQTNVEILYSNNNSDKLEFSESLNFNNRSDKFDLAQHRKNTRKLLIDKVFDKIVKNLRTNK